MGLAVDPDGELTFEDVEPLALVVVDVERRTASAWGRLLGDHGAVARRLDRRQPAEKPEMFAGAGLLCDGGESGHVRSMLRAASRDHPSRARIFLARGGRLRRWHGPSKR